jgi:hypothetical protein
VDFCFLALAFLAYSLVACFLCGKYSRFSIAWLSPASTQALESGCVPWTPCFVLNLDGGWKFGSYFFFFFLVWFLGQHASISRTMLITGPQLAKSSSAAATSDALIESNESLQVTFKHSCGNQMPQTAKDFHASMMLHLQGL